MDDQGQGAERRYGRRLSMSEAEAARIRKQAGKPPPDNRSLRAIIWCRLSTPLRWPAARRERKGLPPRQQTWLTFVAQSLFMWLALGVPLAWFVDRRGGLGPNMKGSDAQYFSWAPSVEAGRRDAVLAFFGTGLVAALAGVLGWRESVRDDAGERPSTRSGSRQPRYQDDGLRRHPFPAKEAGE